MDKNKVISLVVLLLISAVGSLGFYCYNLNQELNKSIETNVEEKSENDNFEISTLFNNPVYLKTICAEFLEKGSCNKNLGKVNLNNNIYSVNINLFSVSENTEYSFGEGMEGYLQLDNINIELSGFVNKIEKINNVYLGIFSKISDGSNILNIYDEKLNLKNSYTADNNGFIIDNNIIEYTEPSWIENSEVLEGYVRHHKITIQNNEFNEIINDIKAE